MAVRKQIFHFTAEVKNVEIRKIEEIDGSWINKDGKFIDYHYIRLTCDDAEQNRVFFRDNNMENLQKYKRGMIGTVVLRIDAEESFETDCNRRKYSLYERAKFRVIDFVENT